jgi:RNA polymerase sigma-70 factor, ECF subfamily
VSMGQSDQGQCDHHGDATASSRDADRRAREQFVRETEPIRDILWRRATRLTNQRADAEDLMQETLLKAYSSFDKYAPGTNFVSWLLRIMSNTWVDRHRTALRRPAQYPTADFTHPRLAAVPSHLVDSSGLVGSAEEQALRLVPGEAEIAVRALPRDLRETVYYLCVAGYRNAEVAALLDIPAGTVASRLHRAKGILRAALNSADDQTRSSA